MDQPTKKTRKRQAPVVRSMSDLEKLALANMDIMNSICDAVVKVQAAQAQVKRMYDAAEDDVEQA